MKTFAFFLLSTSLLTAAPLAAQAQAPASPAAAVPATPDQRLALAREFVALTFSPDDYIAMWRDSTAMAAESIGKALTAQFGDDGKQVENPAAMMTRMLTLGEPLIRVKLPLLADAYAQAYARDFTAPELAQMVAFGQSPAGKHFLAHQDRLDLDPSVLKVQQEIGEDMMPVLDQMRKEACAKKAEARIAAGDKTAKCPLAEADEQAAS